MYSPRWLFQPSQASRWSGLSTPVPKHAWVALRLARAFTGRQKVLKFEGCYHGHADAFLVKAGSGVATLGLPDSPGVPKAATSETLTAPYNDLEAVKNLFEAHKGEIAAVILEPVVGNAGFIVPKPGFLSTLRQITEEDGALLIFDEVMTGYIRGMFGFFFTGGPAYNFEDAKKSDTEKFARFHRGMLEEGVYLAPSQFEAGFTSLAHSSGDIEGTVEAAKRVFQRI